LLNTPEKPCCRSHRRDGVNH